jgi:sugar phosphate isomerase/epimerase
MKKSISRRGFLAKAGGGLALAGIGPTFSGCSDVSVSEGPKEGVQPEAVSLYAPFVVGFQSYSLRNYKLLPDFKPRAEQLDLRYVELWRGHLPTSATSGQIRMIKNELALIDLTPNAFGVESFSAEHDKNRAIFEFAKELGVGVLTANPSKDAFDSLEKLVSQFPVKIAIHNHGPEDENWRQPDWILQAIGESDSRIGACVDTGHYIRAGVDPVEAIEMLGSRVYGVHLKDFDKDEVEVIPGDGQLDLKATLTALKTVGFEGPLSLEYEGENPVPSMQECLRRIAEAVKELA